MNTFNFKIKSPVENPSSRQQEKLSETHIHVQEVAAALTRQHIERKGTSELSQEVSRFVPIVQKWHEERFRKLGIEHISWGRITYLKHKEMVPEGQWKIGMVRVKDFSDVVYKPVPDTEIASHDKSIPVSISPEVLIGLTPESACSAFRNYIQARVLSHEQYHAAAPLVMEVEINKNESNREESYTVHPFKTRHGMNYGQDPKTKPGASAFEEGLAMIVQFEAQSLVEKEYPDGANLNKVFIDEIIKRDRRVTGMQSEFIQIHDFDGHSIIYSTMPYAVSYILVQYLTKEIQNFFRLVEDARINGNLVPLVSAIERKFGAGMYEKLTLAKDGAEVVVLLEELRSIQ